MLVKLTIIRYKVDVIKLANLLSARAIRSTEAYRTDILIYYTRDKVPAMPCEATISTQITFAGCASRTSTDIFTNLITPAKFEIGTVKYTMNMNSILPHLLRFIAGIKSMNTIRGHKEKQNEFR